MAAAGLGLLSPQLSAVLQEVVDLASIGYSMPSASALTYKADTGRSGPRRCSSVEIVRRHELLSP